MNRWGLVGLLSVLGACGGSTADRATIATAEAAPPPPVAPRWVPLERELSIHGRAIRQPVMRVSIGGAVDGVMFVDTGAASSFLEPSVIQRAGLTAREVEITVSDAHEARTDMLAVLSDVAITVSGSQELRLPSAVGIPLPPPFVEAGILGGLNPQSLADDEHSVVLDLGRARLARVPRADAPALLTGRRLDDETTRACRHEENGVESFVYLTEATIADQPVLFIVDTGAETSRLSFDSPAARALYEASDEEVEARGVVGGQAARLAHDVSLRIGEATLTLESVSVSLGEAPERECPFFGLIGQDVLGSCVLVMDRDRLAIACPEET